MHQDESSLNQDFHYSLLIINVVSQRRFWLIFWHDRLRLGVFCTVPGCQHCREKFEDVWLGSGYLSSGRELCPQTFSHLQSFSTAAVLKTFSGSKVNNLSAFHISVNFFNFQVVIWMLNAFNCLIHVFPVYSIDMESSSIWHLPYIEGSCHFEMSLGNLQNFGTVHDYFE